ncbi:hypothetical protein JST99_00710 [Candidatus Dependentiae bacterium]|nr:hypothetical protein [Candidatus Dependentiae bacterium]MCC7415247.1 hypothetical protein [Campylobacterota bacterium]
MKKFLLLVLMLVAGMGSMALADSCCNTSCNTSCKTSCNTCDTCCVASPKELCSSCDCKYVSHSFYSIRPPYQKGSPEFESFFRDNMHARKDGIGGSLEIVPFGGRSTKEPRLAAYFGPDCKNVFTVNEDPTIVGTDLLARNFDITQVGFSSKISFNPRHSFAGVGFRYKQGLWESCSGHTLFIDFSMPVVHVRNTLNFCEEVLNTGTLFVNGVQLTACGAGNIPNRSCGSCDTSCTDLCATSTYVTSSVNNMTEAFRQEAWQYGRIGCGSETKTAVANFDVRLGYETVQNDHCRLESYFGFSAPTGNKVRSVNLFEPIVGYNHHFGVMFGTDASIELWTSECEDSHLWMELSFQGLYLVKNSQKRLVDLKGKPWSRYMRVYANEEQAALALSTGNECLNTPGVNIFALDVHVSPGFQRTYNSSFVYTCGGFQGELGYNFFARCAECIDLKCPWVEGPALVAYEGLRGCSGAGFIPAIGSAGATDPVQNINHNFGDRNTNSVANYAQSIIKCDELDLNSAAHPAMLTHSMFGTVGYRWDSCGCVVPSLGMGGSYEFSRDNAGLNRWMLWGKMGLSF